MFKSIFYFCASIILHILESVHISTALYKTKKVLTQGQNFKNLIGATERNRTVIICMASIGTNRCTTAAFI